MEFAEREHRPEKAYKSDIWERGLDDGPFSEEPIPGYGADYGKDFPSLRSFQPHELPSKEPSREEVEARNGEFAPNPFVPPNRDYLAYDLKLYQEMLREKRLAAKGDLDPQPDFDRERGTGKRVEADSPEVLALGGESKLRDNMPNHVFINGAGGALMNKKGEDGKTKDGKAGLQNRVKEFSRSGANTFFVPILTSDGKVGINTTDGNSSKVHRDRKYDYTAKDNTGLFNNDRTYWRDVVDETKEAVNASGKHVGKGAGDAKVIPWVEHAFTTYMGREKGGEFLKDPSKTSGFTNRMKDKVLMKEVNGRKVPIEFMNENGKGGKTGVGYLDPLDPEVQKNVREVISKAASKDYVSAIMVDDHFGIPLDKPDVRKAILAKHPVSENYKTAKEEQIKAVQPRIRPEKLQQQVEDMWLRDKFTKFANDVKADLKAKDVELWASTNLPESAKKNQGQDIERWIRTGLVDNWNVQLYRKDLPTFAAEYNKLQGIAGKIPQVAKGQVPLSVAISSYADGNQLSPETMAKQVSYAESPKSPNGSKKIKTPAVAFDDGAWLKRAKEQK